MVEPELRRFLADCRPVGMGSCACGREHVTLYKHVRVLSVTQCLQCWKEKRDSVPPAPEPAKKVAVEQRALDELVERVATLERQMIEVMERLPKKRTGR